MSKPSERVVFSGVQPTSDSLHLGNALGAVSSGWACRTSSTPTSASSTCTPSRSRRIRPRFGAARSRRPRSTWRWAIDPFRATIFVQSHVPAHTELDLGAGMFHRIRPGVADDAVQGQVAEGGQRRHHRRPVHLSGADGCRRAALRHQPGARRRGPAPAPGTGARRRAALQLAIPRHLRRPRRDDPEGHRQDLRPAGPDGEDEQVGIQRGGADQPARRSRA